MNAADTTFGLYVHWPFCRSKCPYCDFNSHVAETIDEAAWRAAYLAELAAIAEALSGRACASIFFGGGTPSLMDPATVAAIIEAARRHWPWAADAAPEITLEANPTSIEAARFADFRGAGVNRVSVGVQALDDAALKFLGREHSAAEALAALDIAQASFTRVNADMIYARPDQTLDQWRGELGVLMGRGLGHVSLYQLTIERGTPFFGLHRKGAFALPGEDEAAALYEATAGMLGGAGLESYEVSNYARPGEECRHNLVYWRSADYAGIGPGAHGRLSRGGARIATENLRRPDDWIAAVGARGRGIARENALSEDERLAEFVIMGLRLAEGIGEGALMRATGLGFGEAFAPARLGRLVAGGFLDRDRDGATLRATAAGRLRLDAVIAELLS